jgi:hypothetical protein
MLVRLRVLDIRAVACRVFAMLRSVLDIRTAACRVFAVLRSMLGRIRVGCALFFFVAACGTNERKGANENKRSHAADSASFALHTATTK